MNGDRLPAAPTDPTGPIERPGEAAGGRTSRRRRRFVLALVLGLLIVDWSRPGPQEWTGRLLVGSINVYQATLSKAMPVIGVQCRFVPTCSQYGEAVIARDGALVGTAKTAWRLARCGPWTEACTHDPP